MGPVSALGQEQAWSPGGWFRKGGGRSHISLPCFVIKSQLTGGRWALVNPFSWQRAGTFPRKSPAPSVPAATGMPGVRGQSGHSGCSVLHLAVSCSSPNSVLHPGNFLTPLLVPALSSLWNVLLQEDHLTLPTPLSGSPTVAFTLCVSCIGAPCVLVLPGSALAWKDVEGKANASDSISWGMMLEWRLNSHLVKSVRELVDVRRWVFPQGQTSVQSPLGLWKLEPQVPLKTCSSIQSELSLTPRGCSQPGFAGRRRHICGFMGSARILRIPAQPGLHTPT